MQHQDNSVVPLITNTVTRYNEAPNANDVDMENAHGSLEYVGEPAYVPSTNDPVQTPTTSLPLPDSMEPIPANTSPMIQTSDVLGGPVNTSPDVEMNFPQLFICRST